RPAGDGEPNEIARTLQSSKRARRRTFLRAFGVLAVLAAFYCGRGNLAFILEKFKNAPGETAQTASPAPESPKTSAEVAEERVDSFAPDAARVALNAESAPTLERGFADADDLRPGLVIPAENNDVFAQKNLR
ncbi:MAG: hypothetical protein HUK22_00425, partial [Thermoguttaceae bacterium]|nr:hypothetical protein [Thermoguttaceae bacterium]